MLLYHPFFDPHHCVFRMLRLLMLAKKRDIEIDRLRTWDFYLLFPAALDGASLPISHSKKVRSLIKKRYKRQYELLPDIRIMFQRLEPIQISALAHLATRNIIDPEKFRRNIVCYQEDGLAGELKKRVSVNNLQDRELMDFLLTAFFENPMYGKEGIRQRSDLFDCRYDPA